MKNKRKILFIVDKSGWAYHFIVKTWGGYYVLIMNVLYLLQRII